MSAPDILLTEEEAATELRITQRGIETERYARRLGYIKVAGKVRIPMSAIAAYRIEQTKWPVQESLQGSPKTQPRATGRSSGMTASGIGAAERARAAAKKLRQRSATS